MHSASHARAPGRDELSLPAGTRVASADPLDASASVPLTGAPIATRSRRRLFDRRSDRQGPALDAIGLAEGGLLADVSIVLDLATIYLPLVGAVLAPTVPTPFAVLMLRRGPRVTLVAACVAAFLMAVLAGPHFGWRMGLQALVGMLLGWAMRRRLNWTIVLTLGTLLVATAAFASAMGIIFVTGLPIKDVTGGLRNGMVAAATLVAAGANLVGWHTQWLSARPALVAVGLFALRFWPVLLYLYVVVFSLPTVALYFAVANGSARVLGHDVPLFPPRWALRLLRLGLFVVFAPVLLPLRLLRRVRRSRQRTPIAARMAFEEEE